MLYKFGIKYAYVIIQNHSLREQYNENSLNALRQMKIDQSLWDTAKAILRRKYR